MTTAEPPQPIPAVRERSGPSASSREASADARPPPPPYASIAQPIESRPAARSRAADALFNHEWAHLGLPTGFFLLRNAAQGKTLDLLSHRQDEGAELGLHPIKQPLLQGVSLQHKGNNQLFCLSWDGHLIAGASSRAVDVEDWQLVQAFPHPIMSLPSRLSHPPARFRLDPTTSTLHVLFDTDPHYRGPNGSDEWRSYDYIVEAVPRKRKPAGSSAWSAASEQAGQVLSGIGSTAATLGEKLSAFGLFSGRGSASSSQQTSPKLGSGTFTSAPTPATPSKASSTSVSASSGPSTVQSAAGPSTPADPASAARAAGAPTSRVLHVEHDPEEAEPESDSDSEPAAYRPLRVVRLEPGWREKFPTEALQAAPDKSFGVTRWSSSPKELRKWRRRMWDVIPVTIRRMPAPDFPVHNAERAGGTVPMSASESRSASASDSHEDGSSPDDDGRYTEGEDVTRRQQQHLAPPTEGYAMADYFGIGSHETSGASSPVNSRSRRPSAYAAGVTTALSSTVTAASHLTGLLSSRLLPLSLAPAAGADTGDELADEEEGTDGETTGLQATPRLPEAEWDANVVGSRELDALARERQSSPSAESSSAGEWETDAETPRLESGPPPVRKAEREQHHSRPPPPAAGTSQE